MVRRYINSIRELWIRLSQSSLPLASISIVLLLVVGTVGYIVLEGWTLLEAVYATVITITTVGYGDLSPQTLNGRIFSIFFTLIAIGVAGYAISTMAAVVFENEQNRKHRNILRRRMNKIAELQDHIIVCGANIVAHRASHEFLRRDKPFIFIEEDEDTLKWALLWMNQRYVTKRMSYHKTEDVIDFSEEENMSIAELADEMGILYLLADPTDEQQLRQAGILRASGLVAAMPDDLDNIAIILSARDMANRFDNSDLRIVTRVNDEWNIRRLHLAGADEIVSINMTGGIQVANSMLHPIVSQFWDHLLYRGNQVTRVIDYDLNQHPEWVGKTVAEIKRGQSLLVMSIKRNKDFMHAPDLDEVLQKGDILIVMGAVQ